MRPFYRVEDSELFSEEVNPAKNTSAPECKISIGYEKYDSGNGKDQECSADRRDS
jgi:hypothetical protein